MKPTVFIVAILALLALGTSGVANASDLDRKVGDFLVAKLGDDAKTIKVAIVKGEVVLTGEVRERSTQELAKEVALAVEGVRKVDNQIVSGKEKKLFEGKGQQEAGDQKIEIAVEKKVKGELGTHYKGVTIEVVDGVASIRGTVPDQGRHDLALNAMAGSEGVKKVIDLLKVGK